MDLSPPGPSTLPPWMTTRLLNQSIGLWLVYYCYYLPFIGVLHACQLTWMMNSSKKLLSCNQNVRKTFTPPSRCIFFSEFFWMHFMENIENPFASWAILYSDLPIKGVIDWWCLALGNALIKSPHVARYEIFLFRQFSRVKHRNMDVIVKISV